MFGFNGYIPILNNVFIPDITNIIISYIDYPMKEFTKDFLNKCIKNGDYLFYTKQYSLLNHIISKNVLLLDNIFKNNTFITVRIEHFNNISQHGITELFFLCDNIHNAWNPILKLIANYDMKYFQKYFDDKTCLHLLCGNCNYDIICLIPNLKKKYFQNKDYYYSTELDILHKKWAHVLVFLLTYFCLLLSVHLNICCLNKFRANTMVYIIIIFTIILNIFYIDIRNTNSNIYVFYINIVLIIISSIILLFYNNIYANNIILYSLIHFLATIIYINLLYNVDDINDINYNKLLYIYCRIYIV